MDKALPLLIQCPNCAAPVGRRCTIPTDDGRKSVRWVHMARMDAANEQLLNEATEYMVDFNEDDEAQCEFYDDRDKADEFAKSVNGVLFAVRRIASYEKE